MHVGINRDESYTHVRPLSRSLSLSCHPLGPFHSLSAICVYSVCCRVCCSVTVLAMSLSLPYVYIVCVAGCVAV